MNIDLTTTDLLLFAWGAIMTGLYLDIKRKADDLHMMIHSILDNSVLRERVLADFNEWKANL